MKNFDKHEFDEIFRAGLTAPDLNEIDEDWGLMKARLQNQKSRKPVPYYMIWISSVAAVLLLVFSLMFNSTEQVKEPAVNAVKVEDVGSAKVPAGNSTEYIVNPISGDGELMPGNASSKAAANRYFSSFNPNTQVDEHVEVPTSGNSNNTDAIALESSAVTTEIATTPQVLAVIEPATADVNAITNGNLPIDEKAVSSNEADATAVSKDEQATPKSDPAKSRFSLAINFAPDLNGVEQLQNNKVSYSLGAGIIYKISNKLSVEAGAAYGKKTYQTGFSSFRPASYNLFQVKPNVVSSGFDIMDIQLNLAYTLLNKGKSSIGIGAGISSYLMLDEQYSFTYQNLNARGVSSFNTGYQNNHFFGIANLNLSYKRSLTNNVKLALNPYLKLPLTDLGYGNIRLRSAGMSVGVITNLNKNKIR